MYLSSDGNNWEKYTQFIDFSTGEQILDNSVYSSFSTNNGDLWIGTGDGLAIMDENSNACVKRFWNHTESPEEGDFNFSVYPNPFYHF